MSRVVFVGADWCGPCKIMKAEGGAIQTLKAEGVDVEIIDADTDEASMAKYGVRGLPTAIFLNSEDEEVSRLVGLKSLTQLKECLV
ncbi:thioredoxin family protein [bacterium]|nr:thioredoxin family protein [bacterium]